jgi:hypothetical protein
MNKSKLGKSAVDIFAKKEAEPKLEPEKATQQPEKEESLPKEDSPKEKKRRGRPQEHREEWTKVTVVLLEKQIHWLDRLALNIRYNTKQPISRAEIIRALISALDESGIDLTQRGTEQEVKTFILTQLGGK